MESAGKAALPLRTKYTEFASSRCFAITCFGAICSGAQSLARKRRVPSPIGAQIGAQLSHGLLSSAYRSRPQCAHKPGRAGEYA
jgi:hypothetical protein